MRIILLGSTASVEYCRKQAITRFDRLVNECYGDVTTVAESPIRDDLLLGTLYEGSFGPFTQLNASLAQPRWAPSCRVRPNFLDVVHVETRIDV